MSEYTPDELREFGLFSLGYQDAEDLAQIIGLGDPKTAHANGFRRAINMLLNKKIIDKYQIDAILEEELLTEEE